MQTELQHEASENRLVLYTNWTFRVEARFILFTVGSYEVVMTETIYHN